MRFSAIALQFAALLAFSSSALAQSPSSNDLVAREAAPVAEPVVLEARKKDPKIDWGKGIKTQFTSKEQATAVELSIEACEKYGQKSGTIVRAYHASNGESVSHFNLKVETGGEVHIYKDKLMTKDGEKRPDSRSPSPHKRAKAPKIGWGNGIKSQFSTKEQANAVDKSEEACTKYGSKSGTIVRAYHISGGESVQHFNLKTESGSEIHIYKDGVMTKDGERRQDSRSPSPGHKSKRAKAPKVDWGKNIKSQFSTKEQANAMDLSIEACEKYGQKSGTIIKAYHISGGEAVQHFNLKVESGSEIHIYKDKVMTKDGERRQDSRSPSPSRSHKEKRAKAPKVDWGKGIKAQFTTKNQAIAMDRSIEACEKYKQKSGTIVRAYHKSNGEDVQHFNLKVESGSEVHIYEDGIVTKDSERRPASRSPSPHKKRAKAPKVDWGKGIKSQFSTKEQANAMDLAIEACEKYQQKSGTIVRAYHESNNEGVQHFNLKVESGSEIHIYKDKVMTKDGERRPASRSPSPHKRSAVEFRA